MNNILGSYLTTIANAIRTKTGETAAISAADFASKILALETAKLQAKTVSLTSTAATAITPDSGYTGMSKVTVTPKLQSKTQTVTSNTTTTIKPDSGYAGLSQVSVKTNVASQAVSAAKSVWSIGGQGGWTGHKTATISGLPGRKCILVIEYRHSAGIAGFSFSNGTGADQHIVINSKTATLLKGSANVNYLGYLVFNSTATSTSVHYALQSPEYLNVIAVY